MDLKLEALDKAVRVALAQGGELTSETVERAEAFYQFLNPSLKVPGSVTIINN